MKRSSVIIGTLLLVVAATVIVDDGPKVFVIHTPTKTFLLGKTKHFIRSLGSR